MSILPDHYPHLLPSHSSSNQLATRVTLPFWEGRSLSSGEGLGTSLDEAMARRHLGMACHSGGRLPSALAVTLRISSISSRRRLRARITRCVSQACWLALVRFRLQYLGWRSTSLGLGELTPGYCGNAFGVKKDDFVCRNANFRFEGYYRR